jgi:hypothetical protein
VDLVSIPFPEPDRRLRAAEKDLGQALDAFVSELMTSDSARVLAFYDRGQVPQGRRLETLQHHRPD